MLVNFFKKIVELLLYYTFQLKKDLVYQNNKANPHYEPISTCK